METTHPRSLKRFTFHKPAADLAGGAPALREVRDNGTPIGLLNRHRDGYVLRALDGRKLDTTYGIDRTTAAGCLARLVAEGDARGVVVCDTCGNEHEAIYSHEGRFSEGAIFAVVCPTDHLTDYYTTERLI